MDDNLLLIGLKVDLGISTPAYDERLLARIAQARAEIAAMGATLTDTTRDRELVIMYAAWLWRDRLTNEPMPRMLRYALNNRVLSQKASAAV